MYKSDLYQSGGKRFFNHDILLDFYINSAHGYKSNNRNYFKVDITIESKLEKEPICIMTGSGYLFLGNESFSRTAKPWINKRISISDPIPFSEVKINKQISIIFDLSYEDIEYIEKERNGKDPELTLGLDLVIYIINDPIQGFSQIQGSSTIEMPQSLWRDKCLKTWDYLYHHFVLSRAMIIPH